MRSTTVTIAGLLALAALASGAWLAQVLWGVGWAGLAWLELIHGPETLPSCLFIAAAVAVGQRSRWAGRPWQGLLFVALLTGLGFGVYQLISPTIASLAHPTWAIFLEPAELRLVLARSAALVALAGLGFSAATWGLLRWLAGPQRRLGALAFALTLLLVAPCTALLGMVFPALNGAHDFVHAVKMGYPPGLTALGLGLASWWGGR